MLERKKYNEEMDAARKNQVRELAQYLEQFFDLNVDVRQKSCFSVPDKETMEYLEKLEIPKKGRDPKEVGDELVEKVLSHNAALQHPRTFSLVCSGVSPYSIAGSLLTDIYNPNVACWDLAPTLGIIEEKLIKFLCSRAGWDVNKCGGLFTSGGSLSNLTCMIAARETKLPGRFDLSKGVAIYSDQDHSSVIKGLHMMGLRDDQCIKIESDDDFKIRLDLAEEGIKKAIADGMKPFLLIGCIGTTNTGSIDPLPEMAELSKKYDMWLHIDGAYGGSILFSDIYNNLAKGVELADSLSWDTHKWALQTYSCSCALVKDKQNFLKTFNEHPEYLADVTSAEHNDAWDLGIEMSRPARYVKLWYTLQAMGTDLLADVIDYSFFNAKQAERSMQSFGDWEQISKVSCGCVNFRYAPADVDPKYYDELNARISQTIVDSGFAHVLTTTLKGNKVIRLIVINANTETEDVINVCEMLNKIALELKKEYINK